MHARPALALAVALAAALLYANSLVNGFVFDDRQVIERNDLVRGPLRLGAIFATPYLWGFHQTNSGLYRPIPILSFALNHAVGGAEPLGYHAVNVVLHACVSVLVFAVGASLGLPLLACMAAGLLFAAHPVHTEAVANLAGRAELLSAGFVLLALLALRRGGTGSRDKPRAVWIVAAAAAFLLALLSKENAITFLGIAAAWDLVGAGERGETWRESLRRRGRRAVLHQLVLLGAVVLYLALRANALAAQVAGPTEIPFTDNPVAHAPLTTRWITAIAVVPRYALLGLFPWKLAPDYSYATIVPLTRASDPAFLAGLAVVAGTLAVAWLASRRSRILAFLFLFGAATVSIVSNLVVPIGTILAERLLYLPSVPLCLLAGAGVAWMARHWGARVALVLGAAVLVAASARTVARNRDWRDGLTLFQEAARTTPRSVKVLNNLGVELRKAGRAAEAEARFREAVAIDPGYASARLNLAQVKMSGGDVEGAVLDVRAVLARNPEDSLARLQLGEALLLAGDVGGAAAVLGQVAAERPSDAEIRHRLGAALAQGGDLAGARREMELSLALRPDLVPARNDLALILQRMGDTERAIQLLRQAIASQPASHALHNNLGNLLRDAGRLDEAQAELAEALRLQPGSPATLYNLALLDERRGAVGQAEARLAGLAAHVPPHPGAHRGLGRIALRGGRTEEALSHLDAAVAADATDAEANALRGRALMILGRRAEAEAAYRRALDLDPGAVSAWNNLAVLLALRGDTAGARRAWEEALRQGPDPREAQEIRNNLARLGDEP